MFRERVTLNNYATTVVGYLDSGGCARCMVGGTGGRYRVDELFNGGQNSC